MPTRTFDLNGGASGVDASATYNEGQPALAVLPQAFVTTHGGGNQPVDRLTLQIANAIPTESLTLNDVAVAALGGGTWSYDSATGTLTVASQNTADATWNTILRNIVYFTANAQTPTRTVTVTAASPDSGHAQAATLIITIPGAVDDAPGNIALNGGPVAEDAPVGTVVGTASATDPENAGGLTYALLDDAGGRFAMDPSGQVTVAGALDYESAASYQITIRVTDSGGLSSDQVVTVGVSDVVEDETFFLTSAPDIFDRAASSTNFTLDALESNDTVVTGSGRDHIAGGAGDDVLTSGSGDDMLAGGLGNDLLRGMAGSDTLDGGDGLDTLSYQGSNSLGVYVRLFDNSAFGGDADGDTISGFENVVGSFKNDSLIGSSGSNALYGSLGNDTLQGLGGNDVIVGGLGADALDGGDGFDTLSYMGAIAGVYVRLFNGTAFGADANGDTIAGFESVTGSSHGDDLIGSQGNDYLNGALGSDLLTGLGGRDTFRFFTALGEDNVDTIADYTAADDTIQLDDAVFAGLAIGGLAAGAFHTGAAAHDADDRIVYDSATGALWFDADGNGDGAAVQFATLSAGLVMTASEFVVI